MLKQGFLWLPPQWHVDCISAYRLIAFTQSSEGSDRGVQQALLEIRIYNGSMLALDSHLNS